MIKKTLTAVAALALTANAASAANVLIFGDRGYAQDEVQTILEGQGDTVTNVSRSSVPVDLSVFDTVWSLSYNSSYGTALEDQLIDFVANGGGLYLTFERPCCEAANDSVERIIDSSLLAGDVTVGGFGDVSGTFTYNANAIGNLDADLAVGWPPSSPGQISGVSGRNVVVSSDVTGRAVAAGWDETDLGAGRIAAFGDIDWLNSVDANEAQVVLNTQEFLYDGYVGPNPDPVPLPAGGVLLVTGLGAMVVSRRRATR
ncbi:hypothetical protein RGUI_0672 [Rhodovulum sp. P5]|uniref:VPLPA-CTERM sorting domain-containing protein n=1 Tax=Rhodovulum sp. P5 TaxID=1564506 RepID=UPI0009C1E44D|nr:VPLPA-CTERM sorting domain-containing protein [Rhodovulum sp. P5]ARE38813.1 hypothetical protein RGUI_0672 [Rhodovulum sp. P5]